MIFFFLAVEGGPRPLKVFFWGSRGRPGARKCVRGVVFLLSSGSLLTSFLDPKKPPKIGSLKLLNKVKFRFYSLLEIFKNSRGQLGPQEGPGRLLQEAKNGLRSRLRVGVRFCTDFGSILRRFWINFGTILGRLLVVF